MKTFPTILPVATMSLVSLGALMYAGNQGYNCVGAYNSRTVAQTAVDWRWYLAGSLVASAGSFVPLLMARLRDPGA